MAVAVFELAQLHVRCFSGHQIAADISVPSHSLLDGGIGGQGAG